MIGPGEFYEDDEPIEDVERAFAQSSQVGITWSMPVRFTYSTSANVKMKILSGPVERKDD